MHQPSGTAAVDDGSRPRRQALHAVEPVLIGQTRPDGTAVALNVTKIRARVYHSARAAYAAGGEHPIASYAVMLSTYVAMVRGSGVRHAIGELLTCPFCVLVWVATLFSFGLVLAPRVTRFAASILAAVTASDSLQFAYARLQQAEHAV